MENYNKNDDNSQTNSEDFEEFKVLEDDVTIIPDESLSKTPNALHKKFYHPVLTFDNPKDEDTAKEDDFITPDTLFSPKDKVSNLTWNNKLPISETIGVTTSKKNGFSGCVVHLDYEKIINSTDVVTGAQLSPFDRCVYDAVVTLYIAGNSVFSTADIWHIISHNPKAKITATTRQKIVRSMFHISRFWISIDTDDSNNYLYWCNLRKNSNFNSERKIYKNLQATYTGRLLEFRVLGNINFDVIYQDDEHELTGKESFPEIWKILDTPILYQYAKAKGQISSTSIQLLNTAKNKEITNVVRRGSCTDELTNFLSREIDTMKRTIKSKQPYSHYILLEHIYKIDGIENVQQESNDLKKKRSRTRNKLTKILNRFKENGMIKDYLFHKKVHGKSLAFYSVEIILT